MSEVSATRTPLTRDATAAALVPAYVAVFGDEPDRDRAELLLALIWLENANGSSIVRFNWGNLAGTSPNFWRPPWFDADAVAALPSSTPAEQQRKTKLERLHARMLAGGAPDAFRAFDSHADGVAAWLRLLSSERMRPVLAAASSGDAEAFARAIFSSGYCPDLECRNAGPSYARLRDQIRAATYFDGLKKKARVVPSLQSGSPWRRSLFSGLPLLCRDPTIGGGARA